MKIAKHFFLAILMVAILLNFASAQKKLPGLDPSPADIALFRPEGKGKPVLVKVIYGRPQKKGRVMLGGIEPYGKV